MRFSLLLILLLGSLQVGSLQVSTLHAENPWGKDADLLEVKTPATPDQEISLLKRFASTLINFHQEVISPIDGPRSHFYPSSSQYTKEAIQKYGFLLGVVYGCDRLMRENDDPWVYGTCIAPDGRKLKLNCIP